MQLGLFIAAAFVATIPGMLIARLYLVRCGVEIDPEKGTVPVFLEVAPTPVKAAVISLNLIVFLAIWIGSIILLD